jgi:hypothetical protein
MIGGKLHSLSEVKEPLVNSWLAALIDARRRTKLALKGINPEDAIVDLLRNKHQLLIGEPTAEMIYAEFGKVDPEKPRTRTVKGRSMVSGLPAAVEISSLEVQAADNSEITLPYVDWSREEDGSTIGELLYAIAANEANWLYVGVLQQTSPAEIEGLFERNPQDWKNFVRGKTMAQYWEGLELVRRQLITAYKDMTLEDFQRMRRGRDTYCSAEWVVHELCQFEAECRVEITALLADARAALSPKIDD